MLTKVVDVDTAQRANAKQQRAGKKAILVGGGAKRRFFKDEKGAEIWACNAQYCGGLRWLPRVDRAFNLHKFELLKQYGYSFDAEADFVRENPSVPFFTMDRWPKHFIPTWANWQLFPWQEMAKKQPRGMYHCGTFDWFVAYAAFIGVKELTIHGVNLRLEANEPGSAQACLEYWAGYATGLGIEVKCARDCTMFYYSQLLLTDIAYGIDDAPIYRDIRPEGMPAYDYKG